ncbi:MAG: o-succinylbenzoate synthase [Prevotella sp.]|jgi:o-succinylbenzoate synthase
MLKINISKRLLQFKQLARTSRGAYSTHLSYYIKVSQNGVEGVGEASVLPDLSCDAMPQEAYEKKLRDVCAIVERSSEIPSELLRPYPSILFALETAFAQIEAGGSTALFDTPFARGEEGIRINGLVWMGSFEEMSRRLEKKLRAGFHCIKLKIGAIDFERELALVKYIRERYDKSVVELRVDANGGFSPQQAPERLETLAKYDIHSIEQPIKQHQWREMAALCRNTPLPIALDEELIGVNDYAKKEELIETIRPQYLVLKPSLHGGMRGTEEWISLARSRGIGSWITSALESNVGLNAVAQLCARCYGPAITMPQGLGTGQLYENNIEMPLHILGEQLWYGKKDV